MDSDDPLTGLFAGTGALFGPAGALGGGASLAGAASGIGSALSYVSPVLATLQGISGYTTAAYNADLNKQQAREAEATAAAETARQRRIDEAKQSAFIASAGASGTMFEGSPMLAYLENAKNAELNAQDILYSGALKARGLRAQASLYKQQGGAELFGGLAKGAASLGSTLLRS